MRTPPGTPRGIRHSERVRVGWRALREQSAGVVVGATGAAAVIAIEAAVAIAICAAGQLLAARAGVRQPVVPETLSLALTADATAIRSRSPRMPTMERRPPPLLRG